MKVSIEPFLYSVETHYGISYASGTISIGDDFSETITMALNFWSIKDYERQWKEGLQRIKAHDISCLVASVQNPITSNPLINLWALYKEENKVFIYNQLIVYESYPKWIGSKVFSPDNCYDFIDSEPDWKPEDVGETMWIVDLESL